MLLDCKNCSALVATVEIATHVVVARSNEPFECDELWTFAYCPRCKSPMLAVQMDFGDGFAADSPVRRYPPPERRLGWSVPKSIREAFAEAVSCFKAKAYTACAIMCRKAVEGLCTEHGVTERTLALGLQRLRDQGIIEARLFEWAEQLRNLGNAAAHGVGTHTTREDASDILEFTEALTEYVFTYRDRFKAFKERQSKPPGGGGAA